MMNNNIANQEKAFKKLSRLKVGALFLDTGAGKTKTALDLINSKIKKIDNVLWICPCSLKNEIEAEKEKWYPNLEMDIVGCESIGSSSRIYLETLNKVKSGRTFIVVDESLKIKNRWAKRTRRILEIGEHSKYRLILNGTPLSRNILDMWTQMQFLSPKILNMSFNEFKNTYCEYYTKGKLKGKVRSECNVPHLISLIEPYIFESKLEIETEKRYHTEYYYLNSYDAYEAYKDKIFDEYYNELEDDLNFNAFTIALQKWYCDFKNSDKKEVLQETIDRINDKVIVFVRYLSSIPDGSESITGDDNMQSRKDKIKAFKEGKFNVLYITYGCGAYGLNLQFCKNIIFAEQVWDYALRVQAEARIYRMGQGSRVDYYDLTCSDVGLENLISDCIIKKDNLLYTVKQEIAKKGAKEWVKSL